MEDIFNDSKFNEFLYGQVRDLDEPVGRLVYNLYCSGIKPFWSCSGHIGSWIRDSEKSAIKDHYVFDCGRLYYQDSPEAEALKDKLNGLVRIHNFARLEKDERNTNFILDMEDIAVPCNIRGKDNLQIPIEKAKERYSQFLGIWADLTQWSESLNSNRRQM